MKTKMLLLFVVMAMIIGGCGASKDYVNQQIMDSENRQNVKVNQLRTDTEAEMTKLRDLAAKLSTKADLAINKAAGFENYQIIWSGEINFDYDSYDVNAQAAAILDEAGQKMEQHSGSIIEIVGHTDRTGSAKYNKMLGEQRANSARVYLAEHYLISLYRMFTLSYGEDKPIAMPDEKQGASRNRRVVLKIWGEM